MADGSYNRGLAEISAQSWAAADIRVLLLDDDVALTFDRDHNFVADVLGVAGNTEMTGTGYARQALAGKVATEDDTNDRLIIDHDDITYTAINAGTAGAAVYFRQVTNDADSPVWFWKDSGFPFVTNGSDMVIATGADGLATLADAP